MLLTCKWVHVIVVIAYGLGKAGADSEALGMRKEVAMGNQVGPLRQAMSCL